MNDQKILLEKELADQQKKLEQVVAKVRLAEEKLGKLEKEESRCASLEETVRKSSKIDCTHQPSHLWDLNSMKPSNSSVYLAGFLTQRMD